jgi:hypothetical protein
MRKRVDIIFTLKSPLHIGYLPFKGSVISPTRYYVPGKNFWGAITKRTTEHLYKDPHGSDYREVGDKIKNNFRFSYFYLYDDKTIYIPSFADDELKYGNLLLPKFEHKFIGSRVLTEIDKNSGTAKDESLHEIEFIKDKYIDENEEVKTAKIIGCIWIKEKTKLDNKDVKIGNNGIFINDFNIIEELTLGGELGYGFGLVKLESIIPNGKLFPIKEVSLEEENILIEIEENQPIISHLQYDKSLQFKGDIEPITGRGYFDIEKNTESESESENEYKKNPGKSLSKINYFFSPGSIIKLENNNTLSLNWNGILKVHNSNKTN